MSIPLKGIKMVLTKKKSPQARIPVTPEERQVMLFWYTVYNGNCSAVAKKIVTITGIRRSRKVVSDIANKHNFNVYSHIVRDKVNKEFYGDATPGMARLLKMGADLLELDDKALKDVRNFWDGKTNTRVQTVSEALAVMKHVDSQIGNLVGVKEFKQASFGQILEKEGPAIEMSMKQILDMLDEDDRTDVLKEIVDRQINTILEHKGDSLTKKRKKRQVK